MAANTLHVPHPATPAHSQAVDLVSYVEFQKNYRSLMEYHKAALEATRDFWRLVMRDSVPVRARGRGRLQKPVQFQPHAHLLQPTIKNSSCSPAHLET